MCFVRGVLCGLIGLSFTCLGCAFGISGFLFVFGCCCLLNFSVCLIVVLYAFTWCVVVVVFGWVVFGFGGFLDLMGLVWLYLVGCFSLILCWLLI